MGLPTRLHGAKNLVEMKDEDFCMECEKFVDVWIVYREGEQYYKRGKKCKHVVKIDTIPEAIKKKFEE